MATSNLQDGVTSLPAHHSITHTDADKLDAGSNQQHTIPDNLLSNNNADNLSPEKPSDKRPITGWCWFLICIATFSANLLFGLDTTIAADIQGAVSTTFSNVTQLGWLGIGFGLGSTVAILPIGKAYAMFDTKWLFIGSLLNFAGGSTLCGAAPTMNALIVGRVWAGCGGAGMYLGTINIIATLTTPAEKAVYFALEAFIYGAGCILGPVVGGLLADSAATWRWAFYLNLVLFGIMSPIYAFILPPIPRQSDVSFSIKIIKLDWLGTIFTAAIYISFVLAFSFGGSIWAWSDGRFIALVVLFIGFTVAFGATQHFTVLINKTDRLFPCEFISNPQLVLLYISMACGGATLSIVTYYIPLYFLFIHGDSGTQAAIRLLPFVCFYVVSILTCGYAMQRIGYHMVWYLSSGLFMTIGGVVMYTVQANTPTSHVYGFSILLGLGLTVSQAGYSMGIGLVDKNRASDVIQFMNFSQGQASMLGLAIASAIFQNEAFAGLKGILDGQGFSDAQIHSAITGSRSIVLDTISPELRQKCFDLIVHAIQLVWVLVIAAGSLMTVTSLFLSKKRF